MPFGPRCQECPDTTPLRWLVVTEGDESRADSRLPDSAPVSMSETEVTKLVIAPEPMTQSGRETPSWNLLRISPWPNPASTDQERAYPVPWNRVGPAHAAGRS